MSDSRGETVAVIPARGGSKAIPRKNLALLGGRPLLVWAIDVAKRVGAIDRIIVSTDDAEIADVGRRSGAEVWMRPAHLATDGSLVIDALRDLIERLSASGVNLRTMVLLEPTSPLRSPRDVSDCVAQLEDESVDSAATFTEASLNPYRAWQIAAGKPGMFIEGVNPWLPRQRLPHAFQLNGAVYAFRADRLPETGSAVLFGNAAAVVMPPERSVDIDGPLDLVVAEALLARSTGPALGGE